VGFYSGVLVVRSFISMHCLFTEKLWEKKNVPYWRVNFLENDSNIHRVVFYFVLSIFLGL
jgi:hypothetical protein